MKQRVEKSKKHIHTYEYEEHSHHIVKKIKTHKQRKANNAIDRALKQRDLRSLYDDDFYQ